MCFFYRRWLPFSWKKIIPYLLVVLIYMVSESSYAVRFEPGVGYGIEYTDNATLSADNQVNDLISATYIGAQVSENEGALKYRADARYNNHNYTQDTYTDQQYFDLAASANWEMIKERFSWFLSDKFSQSPIVSLDANTPDNLQDSNIFRIGANIDLPISRRQHLSVVPSFSQYYYEVLLTDNKQYSLAANWNYQMSRLSNIGLSFSTRNIDYIERTVSDTRFTNLGIVFSGIRKKSTYAVNLGSTNVKRDDGEETSGFSGYANWLADLSSRSKINIDLSTDLTDTSSVAATQGNIPGNGNDVQITTDVIRNSVANLTYLRDDASWNSSIYMRYNEITYSDNPLDRVVRAFGATANRPITGLLSSGAYINYNRTKQIDSGRIDERYSIGGNLRYNFSRKLHGFFDIKYRKKESSSVDNNFDEVSVFASLVYGFGEVYRPTRVGGF